MARRTRSANLETRTNRLKLPVRQKPYTAPIAPRIALAYRRNLGPGAWSVKAPFGLKRFALADDFEDANGETVMTYWEALDKAKSLARAGEGSSDALITVKEAVDNYAANLATRGAQKDNAQQIRRNLPETLAAKPVSLLGEKELRTWRDAIVKRGLKPASADRVARVFKAALNLAAADDPRITNANVWRNGLKRLPDGETARNVILDDATVRDVVRTAYEANRGLGIWIDVLAETGARESQIARSEVFDLQDGAAPRLMVPTSKKGRNRRIERKALPISPRLAAMLRQEAAGRAPHQPLLRRDFSAKLSLPFKAVVERLGLDAKVTPYSLRHSSIVRQLLNGVPVRVVASHHDTSVAMIERHYSRYITGDPSDALTRRTLLSLDAPAAAASSNVVPIGR
jgi:hypothetical protein